MITKNKTVYFPLIRRFFESTEELAELIGRSRNYTTQRMNGHKEFNKCEKIAIAQAMGVEVADIFGGDPSE